MNNNSDFFKLTLQRNARRERASERERESISVEGILCVHTTSRREINVCVFILILYEWTERDRVCVCVCVCAIESR
jgi:hypothetical protein